MHSAGLLAQRLSRRRERAKYRTGAESGETEVIRDHILVYDDYIPDGLPVYTGVQHTITLGQADQLGLFSVVDNAMAAGQLTVAIEHSTDGINWTQKSATPVINSVGISSPGTTSVYAGELYPVPQSLEFVRLRISILNNRGAHMRLYATLRDRGKGSFTGCGCDGANEAGHDHDGHGHEDAGLPRAEDHREHLRTLIRSRPHAALDALARCLAAEPAGGALQDRLKAALVAMPERERGEAAHYLSQVAAVEAMERGRQRPGG